jgi:hypothetical protein
MNTQEEIFFQKSKTKDYVKDYNKSYYMKRAEELKECPVCMCNIRMYSMGKHLRSKVHNIAMTIKEKYETAH